MGKVIVDQHTSASMRRLGGLNVVQTPGATDMSAVFADVERISRHDLDAEDRAPVQVSSFSWRASFFALRSAIMEGFEKKFLFACVIKSNLFT